LLVVVERDDGPDWAEDLLTGDGLLVGAGKDGRPDEEPRPVGRRASGDERGPFGATLLDVAEDLRSLRIVDERAHGHSFVEGGSEHLRLRRALQPVNERVVDAAVDEDT